METQLTVRLPADLAKEVKKRAKSLKLKKSEIIRKALSRFLKDDLEDDYPYERVKHLIGSVHSGVEDLATQRREEIIRTIRERNFRDGSLD